MDFNQLWQDYKDLILVIAGGVVAVVFQQVLPAFWRLAASLSSGLGRSMGRHLSEGKFEERYLQWLREEQRFLPVRGIRTRSPVAVELERVYVPPALTQPELHSPRADVKVEHSFDEELTGQLHLTLFHRASRRPGVPVRLSIADVMRTSPERVVILGGPGTGKTTLLRYLALTFARGKAEETLGLSERRMPILIPVRSIVRRGTVLSAEQIAPLTVAPELSEDCPPVFFKKRLQAGECVVLLDGMDEVTSEEDRRLAVEQIEDFVNTYPMNRFIITSRPAGYSSAALVGFTQFEICDFSNEDIERFVFGWCQAVEVGVGNGEPGMPEIVARDRARKEAEELLAAIRANPRVRRLTVNPLLLTIVAMVHRYRATLPNRRVDLYEECIQVLLGYWDEAKGIAGQLDWSRKRRVLERVAYWMHQRGVRDARGAEVETIIAKVLPTVGERETSSSEFLRNVQDRSGLLLERSPGVYGFSHLTFQEYLTASHLIDRAESGRAELLNHLQDPWWLEVILLYAAMRDATPLLDAILMQPQDLFKSNLFLAARCLLDVVNIDPAIENEILVRLMDEFQSGEFEGLREAATEALIELGGSHRAKDVLQRLLSMLNHEDSSVRSRAADVLRRLGYDEIGIITALRDLLRDSDEGVRAAAVLALGELDVTTSTIMNDVISSLGDEAPLVRRSAARILREIQTDELQVVEALLEGIRDIDEGVRENAAETLAFVQISDDRIVPSLLSLLHDEHERVRIAAGFALGSIGAIRPETRKPIFDRLDHPNSLVRVGAIAALAFIPDPDPSVIDRLFRFLADEDVRVRMSSTATLGLMAKTNMELVRQLVEQLKNENWIVRAVASFALRLQEEAHPVVVDALIRLLDDEEVRVRASAALSLGGLGAEDPRVVTALLPLLDDDTMHVRTSAAIALGQLGCSDSRIADLLLTTLKREDVPSPELIAAALDGLGETGRSVIEAVLNRLGDQDPAVRRSAALILDPMGAGITAWSTPTLAREHIPQLLRYLLDRREIVYSHSGVRKEVRDVAWRLLRTYSWATGERIDWDSGS